MENQTHTGLLRISFACFFILFILMKSFSQKNVRIHAGVGVNQIFSNKVYASDLENRGSGTPSYMFHLDGTLKFSKFLSISVGYMRIKNHINIRFQDMEVTSYNNQTNIGSITFEDDIFLYGNQIGINLNYEKTFKRNNFVFSLGGNRTYYNSEMNYINRHYASVPSNSKFSNIDSRQTSKMIGPKVMALDADLMYERMFYKNNIGFFAKLKFIYNFIDYSFEYTHGKLGWEDRYHYTYGNATISNMDYYRLSYHTLIFSVGVFYNLNIKANEKSPNN